MIASLSLYFVYYNYYSTVEPAYKDHNTQWHVITKNTYHPQAWKLHVGITDHRYLLVWCT